MKLLECEHVKVSQTLLKSARQQFYHICSSLSENFSNKKFFLVTSEILRPFLHLLTLDDKYSLGNRENVTVANQMQLSKKRQIFSTFFTAFLKSTFDFGHFGKKITLLAYVFPKLQTGRDVVRNSLRSPFSEQPRIVNILKAPKHYQNQRDSSFLIIFQHFQKTLVKKSSYQSYPKSQYCLFTH